MCCFFGANKKKDHALHYDEVEKFYPLEFRETFLIHYPLTKKATMRRQAT